MKPLHYVLVVAAALLATAATNRSGATHSQFNLTADSRADDGAYRDGLFLGHLDQSRGLHHHLATGRWSTAADRQSFAAGYEQGYSVQP